ncbi:MAG: ATP-binding cassette domain-containing protein, partial [Aeromonas sp.]
MIVASEVELIRGGRKLLDGASATIHPGHKVGLVGKNGCGKSTFFALIRGELSLDGGSCNVPSGWQIAGVAQETPALDCSALEYVIDGDREFRALETELKAAEAADDGMKVADLHGKLDTIGAWSIRARAAELLHGLGFG